MVRAQIKAVMGDLGADIIKIGMLGTADMVNTVRAALDDDAPHTPIVLDPVMIAKGGHPLLEDDAVESVARVLVPRAALITPNAPEAAHLTGIAVTSHADQIAAGEKLLRMGAKAALVKGGHIEGAILRDVLCTHDGHATFEGARIETRATHGTGCTLASSIAALLAQGADLHSAILQARDYLRQAIVSAPGFGAGHGPLNHGWVVQKPAKLR
jgi:hydroxymethylpyrimidine/phosphomethylpyrimidine kinase